jgi:hypothetical protein
MLAIALAQAPQMAAPDPPPWWFLASIVAGVLAVGLLTLRLALRGKARKAARLASACPSCKRVPMQGWARCLFCGASLVGPPASGSSLEFVSGPLIGRMVALDRDVTTIGSVDGNTVLLTDTGVSRKHVGIRRVDGGYELADLGSTNGVYVNGERVARRRLAVGDVIRVGTTEIVFRA